MGSHLVSVGLPSLLAGVAALDVCCEFVAGEAGALDGHGGLGLPEFVGEDVVVIAVRIGAGGSRLVEVLVWGWNHWCNYVTHRVPYTRVGFCEVVPEWFPRWFPFGGWFRLVPVGVVPVEWAGGLAGLDGSGDGGFAGEGYALGFGLGDDFVDSHFGWEA